MTTDITVVVPTSPIKSHPSTHILEETMDSIRYHMPRSTIILQFDGVRPEQQDRLDDYAEYTRRALWMANHRWGDVRPMLYSHHMHQSGMMRDALDSGAITTPMLLYVEADTPIVIDEPIDWGAISTFVDNGEFNHIRLYHEAVVPEPHKRMMLGRIGQMLCTSQYSQRPHLASTAFYRRMINDCFQPGEHVFIEDRMYGVVQNAVLTDGTQGWNQWRLGIWAPEWAEPNWKRSYHTDGRAGERKYG